MCGWNSSWSHARRSARGRSVGAIDLAIDGVVARAIDFRALPIGRFPVTQSGPQRLGSEFQAY